MPELRRDPVTGLWIVVAQDRAKRPTDFKRQPIVVSKPDGCPFCPGNERETMPEVFVVRESGEPNQPGWTTRVVSNRFPALKMEGNGVGTHTSGFFQYQPGLGRHEVIIDCPNHVVSLADATEQNVIDLFRAFSARLAVFRAEAMQYAGFFKNHGPQAGASLEHSHTQLVSLPNIPQRIQTELEGSRDFFDTEGECVFCHMIDQERRAGTRMIFEDDNVVVFAPFASRLPFETWLLPKAHYSQFDADPSLFPSLARALRNTVRGIDQSLGFPPYNLMLHCAPMQMGELPHYHWHIEMVTRLIQIAGFEMGTGSFINPVAPEEAARILCQFHESAGSVAGRLAT